MGPVGIPIPVNFWIFLKIKIVQLMKDSSKS